MLVQVPRGPESITRILCSAAFVFSLGCRVPASVEIEPPAPATAPVFVEQPASEPDPAPEPAAPLTLASFESFLGLRSGDTLEQLLARHGQPAYSEPDTDLDTYYFVMTEDTDPDDGPPGAGDDFLFVVSVDPANSRIFNIQANSGDYAAAGIDEPLLRFIGARSQEVLQTFGEPVRMESGFYTYEYVDEARGFQMDVEFVCYEHDDSICTELWVTWYEPL